MRILRILPLLALAASCGQGGRLAELTLPSRKAIAELPYEGDRPDAPPLEKRGNAQFTDATYDATGDLLITQAFFGSARMQVWNAKNGELIAGFDAFPPTKSSKSLWMIDSKRRRLLAHQKMGEDMALINLMTGEVIQRLPIGRDDKTFAAGLTGDGNRVLLFKPGSMDLWSLDPPKLMSKADSPFTTVRYHPTCTGGIPATYNDKECFEWSADRRTLAVAFTPEEPIRATTEYMLIDVETLTVKRFALPELAGSQTFTSFAFSPDGRWLAVGTTDQLFFYDLRTSEWRPGIRGSQHRSDMLGPMRFTADSARVIALGDQLQINVFEVATGERVGQHAPRAEDWEGELKISADGSRMLVYTFVSDIFEVLDGSTTNRVGWVCPYFCNIKHNPIQPAYAVSPDGKSVAVSQRRGAAVWDTATDMMKFPLVDPKRKPLPFPYGDR